MIELSENLRNLLTRRSFPLLDERILVQRIERKVECVFERLGAIESGGVQVVARCGGIVCTENGKHYVETGIVGIVLPKLGGDHLPARLAGLWDDAKELVN